MAALDARPGEPEWTTDAGSLGYNNERAYFKGRQIEDIYLSATPAYAGTILYTTDNTLLPLGLTLHDTGQIGGAITLAAASQTYEFEVTAEDQANDETSLREFSIFVNEPGVAFIKPQRTQDTIDVPYNYGDYTTIPLLAATSRIAGQNEWGDDIYETLELNLISSNPAISSSGLQLGTEYFYDTEGTVSAEFEGYPTSFQNDEPFAVTIRAKETDTPAFNSVRNLTITILADPDYYSPGA